MIRTVEMYRWIEHRESHKDRSDTFTYTKEWCHNDDNSQFHDSGYSNPKRVPALYNETNNAKHVKLGSYKLSDELISKMSQYKRCPIQKMTTVMEEALQGLHAQLEDDYIFFPHRGNGSLSHPVVGCVRIKYEAIFDNSDVTVVGVLSGQTFRSYMKEDADMGDDCSCGCLEAVDDIEEGNQLRSATDISHRGNLHISISNSMISRLNKNFQVFISISNLLRRWRLLRPLWILFMVPINN